MSKDRKEEKKLLLCQTKYYPNGFQFSTNRNWKACSYKALGYQGSQPASRSVDVEQLNWSDCWHLKCHSRQWHHPSPFFLFFFFLFTWILRFHLFLLFPMVVCSNSAAYYMSVYLAGFLFLALPPPPPSMMMMIRRSSSQVYLYATSSTTFLPSLSLSSLFFLSLHSYRFSSHTLSVPFVSVGSMLPILTLKSTIFSRSVARYIYGAKQNNLPFKPLLAETWALFHFDALLRAECSCG